MAEEVFQQRGKRKIGYGKKVGYVNHKGSGMLKSRNKKTILFGRGKYTTEVKQRRGFCLLAVGVCKIDTLTSREKGRFVGNNNKRIM